MNSFSKIIPLVAILAIGVVSFPSQAAAPAQDGDPLLVKSVWKGTLTQTGEYKGMGGAPPQFDCVFTVTKRDGEKFEAELYEKTPDLELTYIVRGTIKPVKIQNKVSGYKIEWESFDAKDVEGAVAVTKIPYTGTLKEKKIKGTWKHPANDDGTTLEGEFEFELSKKKE